jgi:flagellin-like protein
MNRQLFRNKKGVSPVIASILMIMVVMVGMSILFGALILYSDSFHAGSGSSVLESITVEDVHFINPTTVQLSLFNTGKVELKVTNIYINSQLATLSPTSITIIPGEHAQVLSVTPPPGITFTHSTPYSFKIVTARGTGFEGTYTW